MTEIFLYLLQLTQEKDQVVAVSSVSSSSSCDGLDDVSVIHPCDGAASLSFLFFLFSLTALAKGFLQGDCNVLFFCFCLGVTDTLAPVDSVSVVSVAVLSRGWLEQLQCFTVAGAAVWTVFISLSESEISFSP